ncbi:MAG: trypsin-like serine protease [Clostridia bacterium]|nr:trypsin-like serine protease [Clostridia bacterium]
MKKQKIFVIVIVILLILTVTFAGCDELPGKSAYDLAVENGYEGTLTEWLESLKGVNTEGKSAYELAVENGFTGTVTEWLESLKGVDGEDGAASSVGKSAYELAVENGFTGTVTEWLQSLKGTDGEDGAAASVGKSAYQLAVENGFVGTVNEWLASLKGTDGLDGQNGADTSLMSVSYAANKTILSTVTIYCEFEISGSTTNSAGSGIIIADDKENGDAYIITNYHVVFDSSATPKISNNITLYLYAMQYSQYKIAATYIGGSLTYDVAVLKIENSDIYKNSASMPADISNNTTQYVGETAIAVGNPQGTGISVTTGIVSVDSEYIEMTGADGVTPVKFRVLRIDTAVNSGNSGGGLFNSAGQLIGMVNAKIISSNVENIGYAIPLNVVMNAYNNIMRNCDGIENLKMQRCLLGVTIFASASTAFYNTDTSKTEITETISVESVSETGAAFDILLKDDIILSTTYGGITNEVKRVFELVDFSLNFVHNETLTLTIIRDGVTMDVHIQLVNVIEVE